MADENLTVPPRVGDVAPEDVTVEADLLDTDAEREIDKAVRGRRGIARKYVKWVRRRNPGATPAEIISMLEHHYVTAISVAGAAITVGSIGVDRYRHDPRRGPSCRWDKGGCEGSRKEGGQGSREGSRQADHEGCGKVRRSARRCTTASRRGCAAPVRDHRAFRSRGRRHSRNGPRP